MAKYTAKHAADAPRRSRSAGETQARRGQAGGAGTPRPKKRHRVLRRTLGTIAGVAVVAGLAYGGGLYYFQDHFLPNTTVNGRDVSLLSEGEVAAEISSSTDDYASTITAGDFTYTVKASDIDLKTDGTTAAADALAQVDTYAWPLLALQGSDLTVQQGVSYDEQKLQDSVSQAIDSFNAQATQPEDATWTYDEESGSFEVKPQVDGTAIDKDTVLAAAEGGVSTLSATTTCDDSAKVKATRTADDADLTAAVARANEITQSEIPLVYGGKVKATVTKDQLAQWVSIGDDLSVSVDRDAIASYVADTVAPAVNTEDDDNTYTVARKTLTSKLAADVESGSGETVEIPVTTTAKPKAKKAEAKSSSDSSDMTSGSTSTSGGAGSSRAATLGAYVDVDLSNQYARYYDASGTVLWESNIVSGNTSENRSTPTGTYQINSKATDQTLVGADEDGDGEPDYRSHVTYWMPFIGNSVGLHDATWRGTFGGSIYQSSGSHGCVNLPYAKAQQLYNMVSVGTTVYVHY